MQWTLFFKYKLECDGLQYIKITLINLTKNNGGGGL